MSQEKQNYKLYKKLNSVSLLNVSTTIEEFIKEIINEKDLPEVFFNQSYKQEKEKIINEYRFLFGLINANVFDKERNQEILKSLLFNLCRKEWYFNDAWRKSQIKDSSQIKYLFEEENLIINNYQILESKYYYRLLMKDKITNNVFQLSWVDAHKLLVEKRVEPELTIDEITERITKKCLQNF